MTKNKLKGFTLVELLAVLTILAILSLVAIAIFNGVVKDSKDSATKVSARSYANTVNDNILSSRLKDVNIPDGSYRILTNGDICIGTYADSVCDGKVLELNIQKGNPTDGTVVINDRKVSSLINAKFNNNVISYDFIKDKELEYTTPEINDFSITRYTNSIKFNFTTLNAAKYSCNYGQQDDYKETGIINGAKTECMINDLVPGTTYYYKISITSSAGETVERTGTVQTLSIVTPTIIVEPSGYSLTKTVTINYTKGDIEDPIYYFYTTSAGSTNVAVKNCGNSFEPGECSNTNTNDLQPNNWYKLNELVQSVTITYDSNTTLIAKASDNRVTVATSQLIITTIDKTIPTVTAEDSTYGDDTTIYLQDTQSGIKYFAVTQTESEPTLLNNNSTTTGNTLSTWYATTLSNDKIRVTFTGLNAGEYYAWGKDNLGNYTKARFKVKKRQEEFTIEPVAAQYTGQPIPANTVTTSSGTSATYTYYSTPDCKGTPISVPVNVGNYSVKVEVGDSTNYNAGSKCISHRIIETDVMITMSAQQGIAKGDSSVTFTVSPNVNGTFSFSSNKTSIATVSPMSINAVGHQTYTITVSTHDLGKAKINIDFIPSDSNYKEVNLHYDMSVLETIPVPTSQLTCKKNLKYTGSEQSLIVGTTDGLIYTNDRQTNAGEYTITAIIDPEIELIWEDNTTTAKTFTCSIAKANDEIQVTPANLNYNRNTQTPTITTTSGIVPTVNYYSNNTCTQAATPLNAGTYYLSASTTGNNNYNSTSTGCVTAITINRLTLTPSASCSNKTFDNNTTASCTINLATVLTGDTVDTSKTCTFNNATVGTGKTVTCSISLTGSSAGNYNLSTTSVTSNANITKQQVNPPTNVQVSTAGKVTWTASSNATSYEISIDGSHYAAASSGVDYLSTITGSAGSKRIYVRALNSDTTNFTSPSDAATVDTNVYTLTINVNNSNYGSVSPTSYKVISGATYTTDSNKLSVKSDSIVLKDVTATASSAAGYTTSFSSWSSTSGTITADKTITANFARTANTYIVSADANYGTISQTTGWTINSNGDGYHNATKPVTYGSTYGTLPTISRTGYTFNGWYSAMSVPNVTLTASSSNWNYGMIKYNLVPGATYTITMGSATRTAGSATQFTTLIYDFTTNTTLANVVTSLGSNISYTITCPSTADITHKLRIIVYAGVGGSTANQAVTYSNIKVGTLGNTTATQYSASTTVSATANHQLHASWTANTYKMTLNDNGGSGGSGSVTIAYDTPQGSYPSITKPTRNGFTFNGYWDTSAASGGTQWYDANGNSLRTFNLTQAGTWYARWTANTYYITYDGNGATGNVPTTQSFTFNNGEKISSTTPTRPGYTFLYWKHSTSSNTFRPGDSIPVNWGSFTLVAQWQENSISMSKPTPTGVTENGKILVGSTVTFTCTGSGDNNPKTLTINGGTTVTNTNVNSNSSITASYPITEPSNSFSISATCTGNYAGTVTVTTDAVTVYRKFQLLYNKNGAASIGATSSTAQYLVANSTSSGGSKTSLPSVSCTSRGKGCVSRGWDSRQTRAGSSYYNAGQSYDICLEGTSGCSISTTTIPAKDSNNNAVTTLYAITYFKLYNPTKTANVTTSTNSASDATYIYIYNTATSASYTNKCGSSTPHLVCLTEANSGGGAYDSAYYEICGNRNSGGCTAAYNNNYLIGGSSATNCSFSCRTNAGGNH